MFFRSGFWWIFPLLSGVLLWLSFPNFSLFPLAWVGLIPYLVFLLERPSWKRTLLGHGLLAAVYFGGALYWIPRVLVIFGNLNWLVSGLLYALLIVGLALFLLPFTLLTRAAASKTPELALWTAPGFWLSTELLRNYFAANGFPWAALGYSQYPYSWIIQSADLGGVYLISTGVVAANCVLVGALRYRHWKPLVVFAAVFGGANLYGFYRLEVWQPEPGPPLKVALIQPGIQLAESLSHYAHKYFDELPDYYRRAVAGGADFVIFPEAQNPYSYQDFYFRTFWERQVSAGGAALLFNSFMEDTERGEYYNSALMLGPDGRLAFRYDKIELVPFGEYVPMARWLNFVQPLVEEVSAFSPGRRIEVGQVQQTGFAALICFEGIFPELSRAFVLEGAQLIVNITNDAWFGDTAAPRQHFQKAVFRAIEYRKPLLRAANTGYSAMVGPHGRVLDRLDLFEEGMILGSVSGNSYRTIYSYLGEWLNMAIIAFSVLLYLSVRSSGRRARRKERQRWKTTASSTRN